MSPINNVLLDRIFKLRDEKYQDLLKDLGVTPTELSIVPPNSDIDDTIIIDYRLLIFKTLIKKK